MDEIISGAKGVYASRWNQEIEKTIRENGCQYFLNSLKNAE